VCRERLTTAAHFITTSSDMIDSTIYFSLGVAIAVVAFSLFLFRSKTSKLGGADYVRTELLKMEQEGAMGLSSVSTITYYKGTISKDFLKERVEKILEMNPWLRARLVKENGKAVAVHTRSPSASFINDHLTFIEDAALDTAMTYSDLRTHVIKYTIPRGKKCVDGKTPLFRVTLADVKQGKKCALIVSMSHVLSDGHTFYSIYSMLGTKGEVAALNPFRYFHFDVLKDQLLGTKTAPKPTIVVGCLLRMLFARASTPYLLELDGEWVAGQKEAHSRFNAITGNVQAALSEGSDELKPVPYLSTNDIITSWFHQLTKTVYMYMVVNFRGRVGELSAELVGNYEGGMALTQAETADPASIRRLLLSGKFCTPSKPAASLLDGLLMNIAYITNWTTLYSHILFEGAAHCTHLPLISEGVNMVPHTCIVFNMDETRLGLLFSSEIATDELIGEQPVGKILTVAPTFG
jgi:hypothetical protein